MKYTTTDKINEEPDLSKAGKDKKVRVIPGFHLTLGITVTMLVTNAFTTFFLVTRLINSIGESFNE